MPAGVMIEELMRLGEMVNLVGLDVRAAGGFVNEDEMRGRMRKRF